MEAIQGEGACLSLFISIGTDSANPLTSKGFSSQAEPQPYAVTVQVTPIHRPLSQDSADT